MIISGITLLIIGFSIRLIAIKTNRSYSLYIRRPETLCTHGIYRFIRHPAYTGTLIVLAGLYLLSPMLAFMYFSFMFFLSRALAEEQILEQSFDQYKNYKEKTGRFLPRIRKWLI